MNARLARALLALDGLSVGDAFGERFFVPDAERRIELRALPSGTWRWTDDTAMAISIVEVLAARGSIDRDLLAQRFGRRYAADAYRGYGATAHDILAELARGADWRSVAKAVFNGQGSKGNGGGMRAAPIGAWFADDLEAVAREARASAEPTHAHPDGQAGAVAIAVAAAVAWRERDAPAADSAQRMLDAAYAHTPPGAVRDWLGKARNIPLDTPIGRVADTLGNGSQVLASDTVPYALWCACRGLDDFEEALWQTVSGLGDRDTTCAMVGGIIALRRGSVPD